MAIVKGVDWGVENRARVINMSFAGPADPLMRRELGAADRKGVALVAAAGNAGPKSPPLYPGADDGVIAVTATDADDRLYAGANRGAYIAIAAPGVDVLLPTADGGYGLETGTSVSAALVSGVAALVLERRPDLKPQALRKALLGTAKPMSAAGRDNDFGAGLVDAARAVAQ
jgi:subtilisin family serine protease